MFRKKLALMAIVCTLCACDLWAEQIHSTWVGGASEHWEDAGNWSPPFVPDNNTFVVTINGGTGGVTIEAYDHEINSLNTYGNVELNTRDRWDLDITAPNGLTNYGYLKFDQLSIYKGNIYNIGTLFAVPGTEIWGELEFLNSGMIEMYDGTPSSNLAFANDNTGVIKGYGALHSDEAIDNAGLIRSLGGCLMLHSGGGISNTGTLKNSPGTSLTIIISVPDAYNQGTISVNADGSVVFDCNLVNAPKGTIQLLGGTLAATTVTQTADANFAGFGSITGDVFIDPNAVIKLTGPTNIVGDVTIDTDATLEVSDGTTLVTGHCTCTEGTIHMIGGAIILQGGFTDNNCKVNTEPGLYTNIADFNLDGNVNFADYAYFADTWLWQARP